MTSQTKTIADAVTALLNAGVADDAFVLSFTAERKVLFDLTLVGPELKVWVGGTGLESESAARDVKQKTHTIEVGILRRVDRESLVNQVDQLTELVEQIGDYLDDHPVAGYQLEDVTTTPLYDHTRLMQKSLFAAVLRLPYKFMRRVGAS